MSQTTIANELKLIRKRLDAIERVLAEEMSESDKHDLKVALSEHKRGRSVPFDRVRKY